MHKRVLVIALCLLMVSAFAVTGAVSAAPKTFNGDAGNSPIGKFSSILNNIPFFGTVNHNTDHVVIHVFDQENHYVSNTNTNNPNGPAPPPSE